RAPDRVWADAKGLRGLADAHPSGIIAIRQRGRIGRCKTECTAHIPDSRGGEAVSTSGAKMFGIQHEGNLLVGVVLRNMSHQLIDLLARNVSMTAGVDRKSTRLNSS